jgi:hypothetical protein
LEWSAVEKNFAFGKSVFQSNFQSAKPAKNFAKSVEVNVSFNDDSLDSTNKRPSGQEGQKAALSWTDGRRCT